MKPLTEDLFFNILLILLWAGLACVRIYYRTRPLASQNAEEEQPEGKERVGGWIGVILSIGILGMITTVVLYLIALYVIPLPFILDFQLPLPSIIRWIGVLTGFISIPFLIWIHRTLGKYFAAQLELKEKHKLITVGPYSRVRHPMYTVFILFTSSMALITVNLLIVIFCLAVVLSFPFIARKEEAMLTRLFGDEYRQYLGRTGRFFPRLRRPKKEA